MGAAKGVDVFIDAAVATGAPKMDCQARNGAVGSSIYWSLPIS